MRTDDIKKEFKLEKHPEGGWFSEVYTSSGECEGRALAGSIYFLLEKNDVSHFHQIDCEEIWYYHEGCGMKISVIDQNGHGEIYLGNDYAKGQVPMAVIPKESIFAAVNTDPSDYCFVSCATAPKFTYEGFRLIGREELKRLYPGLPEETLLLAFEDI